MTLLLDLLERLEIGSGNLVQLTYLQDYQIINKRVSTRQMRVYVILLPVIHLIILSYSYLAYGRYSVIQLSNYEMREKIRCENVTFARTGQCREEIQPCAV
jgi:hypothetical protein